MFGKFAAKPQLGLRMVRSVAPFEHKLTVILSGPPDQTSKYGQLLVDMAWDRYLDCEDGLSHRWFGRPVYIVQLFNLNLEDETTDGFMQRVEQLVQDTIPTIETRRVDSWLILEQ